VFEQVRAPSTVGTFLRAFTHGHVQQLNRVLREFLVALCQRVNLLPGTDQVVFVDLELSRLGARCRCCHWSVSPSRSPNPPCASPRNGLSTVPVVRRGSWWARELGSCCPGRCIGRPSPS
jgi:hypothetical protein